MKLSHQMFNQQNRTTLSPDVIPLTSTNLYQILSYYLQRVFEDVFHGKKKKLLPSTIYDRLHSCCWQVCFFFFISPSSSRTGNPGQTTRLKKMWGTANSLNIKSMGNIKRSVHRMVSWFTNWDLEILFSQMGSKEKILFNLGQITSCQCISDSYFKIRTTGIFFPHSMSAWLI